MIMLLLRIIISVSISAMIVVDATNNSNLNHVDGSSNRHLALEDELAKKYDNFLICTNAKSNANFTPMNSLVPNNTIFLATYPTNKIDNNTATCKSKTITRTANISVGLQTIFYSLANGFEFDYDDDHELMICSNSTEESMEVRFENGERGNQFYSNASYQVFLYNDIDGKSVEFKYVYNKEEFYFNACPDNVTKTTQDHCTFIGYPAGDECDEDPFQVIGGLDAYPRAGFFFVDTHEWVDGETHTYEFGSLYRCNTAKYILTAVAEDDKCGLFGLGFFCILKWWKWLLSLFK